MAVDHLPVADDNPDPAVLDLFLRLRGGRPEAAMVAAAETILAARHGACADALATSSLLLSMERRDIDPALNPGESAIRGSLPEAIG